MNSKNESIYYLSEYLEYLSQHSDDKHTQGLASYARLATLAIM